MFSVMEEDGFVLVKKRNGHRRLDNKISKTPKECLAGEASSNCATLTDDDITRIRERVIQYKIELAACRTFSELQDYLSPEASYSEIVCYGLGSLTSGHCTVASRYQLALLLNMVSHLNIACFVFDPVFNKYDSSIIKELGLSLLIENDYGKYKASQKTLFFTPRCPFELINNILWANWQCLSNVVLFGNDLTLLVEQLTEKELKRRLQFIHLALPYCQQKKFAVNGTSLENVMNNSAFFTFDIPDNCSFTAEELNILEPLEL